jgi:hypothetical protein
MNQRISDAIKDDYEVNTWLIKRITDGLSHEDSLYQPPFPANCLNWVLGHIISRRNIALELLGEDSLWSQDIQERYQTGSEPIVSDEDTRQFEELISDLERSQEMISKALEDAVNEDLNNLVSTDRGEKPVWMHLEGFHWHETFHIGQLEILKDFAISKRNT